MAFFIILSKIIIFILLVLTYLDKITCEVEFQNLERKIPSVNEVEGSKESGERPSYFLPGDFVPLKEFLDWASRWVGGKLSLVTQTRDVVLIQQKEEETTLPNPNYLLLVPFNETLSVKSAFQTSLLGTILNLTKLKFEEGNYEEEKEISRWVHPEEILALKLLWEKFHYGKDSFFYKWFPVLPRKYSYLASAWNEHQLDFLKDHAGNRILHKVNIRKHYFEFSWDLVKKLFFQPYAHLFPSSSWSRRNWIWALNTVLTRSEANEEGLLAEQGLSIVPFLDFFNHHPQACNLSSEHASLVDILDIGGERWIGYRTVHNRETGSSLFRCYKKPLSDEESFLRYGFVTNPNGHDANVDNYLSISFELGLPTPLHSEVLEESGLSSSKTNVDLSTNDQYINSLFLKSFRFDSLNEEEINKKLYLILNDQFQSQNNKGVDSQSNFKIVSIRNEYKALRDMEEALWSVSSTISKYDLSDEIFHLLKYESQPSMRKGQINILRLVIGQKKILQWYIHLLKKQWSSLLENRSKFTISSLS